MAILQNCCFCISPRTGAIILGALYLISFGLLTVMSIFGLALVDRPEIRYLSLALSIVAGIFCVFSVILLIGAIKRKPVLLMVWIVFELILIIIVFITFIVTPFIIVQPSLAGYIIGGIINLLLSVYFWLCIVSARQHIMEELRNEYPGQMLLKIEE